MTELKPCPFCGSRDVSTLEDEQTCHVHVYCADCGVRGPMGHGKYDYNSTTGYTDADYDNAVTLWNDRKETQP